MARGPAYLLCNEPTPYDTTRRLWEFLASLRDLDQEDIAVQAAREQAIRYLRAKIPTPDPARPITY